MTVTTDATDTAIGAHPFRHRLLDGLTASINERGYRDTTIADIVRHARTSKRTFYQEFGSKEQCFIELLWATNQRMIAHIRKKVDPDGEWHEQVWQAVDAYVESIETDPAITLSWIRELPALGTAVRSMQRRGVHEFTEMLMDMSDSPGFRRAGIRPFSRPLAVIMVGGLRELIALTVEDGQDVRGVVGPAVAASVALLQAGSPGAAV